MLARWVRADGSIVPPLSFIPLAETSGRIEPMTWQILATALKEMHPRLRDDKYFKLSVNIVPRHLVSDGFVETLRRVVAGAKVSARQIVLEITERAELPDLNQAAAVVKELRELGFRVAMDDVGVGHSGLSQIKGLGVNTIKIDKFFVDTITQDDAAATIIGMLVRLARDLHMTRHCRGHRNPRADAGAAGLRRRGRAGLSGLAAAAVCEVRRIPASAPIPGVCRGRGPRSRQGRLSRRYRYEIPRHRFPATVASPGAARSAIVVRPAGALASGQETPENQGKRMGKKIAIVGAGAVGGYAGAHMVQAGEDVTFIDPWPEHVEHMRKHGLRVTHAKDVPEFTVPVRALHVTDAQQLAKEAPVDIAFVCMKSYDTAWATMLIRQYLAPDGYVVSLQNCMNEETIAGIVGWGKTLGCIASSITVNLPEPGHIHRGAGKHGAAHTVFRAGEVHGRITPRAEEVCRLVAYTDSAKVTDNLWGERWSKLVANVMGNGLSACTGLTGGEMLQSEPIRRFSTRLGSEAIRVGQALGYQLEEILHLPPETIARAGEGDEAAMRACDEQRFADAKHTAVRAAALDGPGHAEGPPHRDRIPQRLCGR